MDSYQNDIYSMEFEGHIKRWDEAIPLGNGHIGCLLWGDGNPIRLSLDRADLWDKRAVPVWSDPNTNYREIIRLVNERNAEKINEMFTNPFFMATPTKIPAGRIEIDYGRPAGSMKSSLSLEDATAYISLKMDNSSSEITAFVSADQSCGFLSIKGEQPRIHIIAHQFSSDACDGNVGNSVLNNSQSLLDYPPAEYGSDEIYSWICQKTAQDLEFAIITARKVIGSEHTEIAFTVASSDDGENWFEDAKTKLSRLLMSGFKCAHINQSNWWEKFWSRSSICLPDKEFERQWYMANYLLGSSSRKGAVPMSLQAVWTADEGMLPPWKGEYANDLNVQMSYWHALKANHLEEHESLTDFLWNLVPKARKFASEFFDAPGLCFPGAMTVDAEPVGGWAMYALSMTSSSWLCQAFVHYWQYTRDKAFLRDHAYPFLQESAECILRWMISGKDGRMYLPLSSSPEIHDDSIKSWLTPYSNFDLSILIYLFSNLAGMADELQNGKSDYWQEKLDQLPELSVHENAGLMLSPDECLCESHRHHSHTLAIYPFNLIDYNRSENEKKIIDQTIANLELLGSGNWNGYSFPWMSCLYAMQGNGEGAAHQLRIFWDCFCSPNSFHLNGDYRNCGASAAHFRAFTLEGNMGAAAALQEMLLQSYNGIIRLFPAIPRKWCKGQISFRHLRVEGGILVSAAMEDGCLEYIEFESKLAGKACIRNDFPTSELLVKSDGSITRIECQKGNVFSLQMEPNAACVIRPASRR